MSETDDKRVTVVYSAEDYAILCDAVDRRQENVSHVVTVAEVSRDLVRTYAQNIK